MDSSADTAENIKNRTTKDIWITRVEEHMTLDLRLMSSNPTLGVEITYTNIS